MFIAALFITAKMFIQLMNGKMGCVFIQKDGRNNPSHPKKMDKY